MINDKNQKKSLILVAKKASKIEERKIK